MRVELLWWEGCPSYPEAIAELRELMREEGLDPDALELREVMTDEDVVPPGDSELHSLTCRVYRLRDGRYSPIPDPADVRAALRTAKEKI
jgi:hypothetical protein